MTTERTPRRRRAITIACFAVSTSTVLALGLPTALTAVLVLVLGVAFARGGAAAALTTTLALVATTALYAVVIRVAGLEDAIYVDPHARYGSWSYVLHQKVYRRNVAATMEVPHGNLQAMTAEPIGQARTVNFVTDSAGFRNDDEYHGQVWALVGDSFVVGNGCDQADTLGEQLEREHGIVAYTLAYPGDVYDYLTYVTGFERRTGGGSRILLFLFEGNDFDEEMSGPQRLKWSALESAANRVRTLFSDRSTYRVTRVLYERAVRRGAIERSDAVWITSLAGGPFGVYRPYMSVSRRQTYHPPPELEENLLRMRRSIAHVFFIPTKYRVYHRHLEPGPPLPNAQWEVVEDLCARLDLRCTDLTPRLIERADELLARDELVWWRDDTHWNRHGIAVAAEAVAVAVAIASSPDTAARP